MKMKYPQLIAAALVFALGIQAYVNAYPLIYLSSFRRELVTNPKANFYAALNHFHHKKVLSDAHNYTSGGSPNQDTLYSWGWIDLRDGPVILSHPEMGDRYFTFEIADMFSDNFAYVGKRITGRHAGSFAIVPPEWKGKLPAEVEESFQSPTRFVLVFGCTLLSGANDVTAVNTLQDQYRMTPLAYWGKPASEMPERRDVWQPYDRKVDPLADWKTINCAWAENPIARDPKLTKAFAEIGVGPGFILESLDKLPEATKRGLARAAIVADKNIIDNAIKTGAFKSAVVNGWNCMPDGVGRSGLKRDFITRASLQYRAGIIANDSEEALYVNTFTDVKDDALTGTTRYVIRVDGKHLPPVNEFWSLMVYRMDNYFHDNRLDRYSVGDRSSFLKREADGSFSVYLQNKPPDSDKESNRLPIPKDNFNMVLRTYGPKQELIEKKWVPPAIEKVK
jgi:hypothetical protein